MCMRVLALDEHCMILLKATIWLNSVLCENAVKVKVLSVYLGPYGFTYFLIMHGNKSGFP